MAEVYVLRPGYGYADGGGVSRAGSTLTLVVADSVRILVDTGGPSERTVVLDTLAQQGLLPEQIAYVVCTHGHTDHIGNNNLFPDATFLVGQDR